MGIGRRLSKEALPKCENPWFFDVNKQNHRSLAKNETFVQLLKKHNYKSIDETTKKEGGLRSHSTDYRTN